MDAVTRGRRLRELREQAGLLQRQVGAHFDIDKASVSAWEAGKTNPSRDRIRSLDELYGADGSVLALYELTPPTDGGSDRTAELARELSLVRQQLAELTATIPAIEARLAHLEEGAG